MKCIRQYYYEFYNFQFYFIVLFIDIMIYIFI